MGATTRTDDLPCSIAGLDPDAILDWIGIYKTVDPSVCNCAGFASAGARFTGSLAFPAAELFAPLTTGDYKARLLFDDGDQIMATAALTVP